MGNLFSFLTGILVGVAVGLLYAPMSGEELRAEIRAEAEVELRKAEAEWNKRLKEVNESLEATRREVKAYIDKNQEAQETQETVEEEAE
ncbi:MAG: YtxH domain-containing protein [Candidatus Promineifilaceae bacterium]